MNVRVGLLLAAEITVLAFLTACGDGDSPSLFARRVQASLDVTAKVSYEFTSDPGGGLGPVSMTITQGRWGRRMDSYWGRENMTFSGTLLDLGDAQYICNRNTGLEPEGLTEDQFEALEEGICFPAESSLFDSDALGGLFDFTFSFRETLNEHDELELEWEATSSRIIAGINADCYEATFTDFETGEVGDADICFSNDDILLSIDVRSSEGSGSFLALEVDRDVQEDDFALPYPVVDWP